MTQKEGNSERDPDTTKHPSNLTIKKKRGDKKEPRPRTPSISHRAPGGGKKEGKGEEDRMKVVDHLLTH